jgi:hypothetical protein
MPCRFNYVEAEPAIAQEGHYEPAAFVRRIRLIVAPSAERNELIQVEIGASLGPLNDVMDIEASPHVTGLAAPAGSREHLRPNRRPFRGAGGTTAQGAWAAGSHPPRRRPPDPCASPQHSCAP